MTDIAYAIRDWHQLPGDLDWLAAGERERYEGFRFDKRRRDWLLGRWAAKVALLGISGLSRRDTRRFEIVSAPSGAPVPRLDGRPYPVGLSLSHSHDCAFAVVSQNDTRLGCDIERIEPRSAVFVETYFTESERELVAATGRSSRDALVTRIWSAKESTLKALQTGLQADTRSVEVIDSAGCADEDWSIARTVAGEDGEFSCLWRHHRDFVLTIATHELAEVPTEY